MINITTKEACCGCGACAQRCVKKCISMIEDSEGFAYPDVDTTKCIDCGLCDKVCPVLTKGESRKPTNVYAAINNNDTIRMASSSGGIFTMLAEAVIGRGGVVFGAIFNERWEVEHTHTETIEGLEPLRKSKYVQSKIGDTYLRAERFLKDGREVMYVGSPCQIAGLHRFLRRDYDNLLTVDFICHGVPSPKVWRTYLEELMRTKSATSKKQLSLANLSEISFRDKGDGWKRYCMKVTTSHSPQNSPLLYEPFVKNTFMRAFLSDLILRPSCHSCAAKGGRSGSDLTIADFWGIESVFPDMDDNRGVGLVLQHRECATLDSVLADTICKESSYDMVLRHNPSVEKSCRPHPKRYKFFDKLDTADSLSKLVASTLKRPLHRRIASAAKRVIKKIVK